MSEPKFVRAETLLNEILFVGEPREKTDKITTSKAHFGKVSSRQRQFHL